MISKSIRLATILAVLATNTSFAQTLQVPQNLAVVNGTPIPTSRADILIDQLKRQGLQNTPQLQAAVRNELIDREVLMQEAVRLGLPERADVKANVALARRDVVLRAFASDFFKAHLPTDAEIRAMYEQFANQDREEYHLHHILVDNEQQAKDLIVKIKAGAKFEDLAKQFSKRPGSSETGGDLGWSKLGAYAPQIAAAVRSLKKGQIVDAPLHTQDGWNIIRVDDARAASLPSLDQMRSRIVTQLQESQLQAFAENLRKNAKIE